MATQRVVRNVCWQWTGMATQMAVGFVLAPFLIRQLGEAGYGLWILIASLTSYFGVLDLGMRGSVGRNVAYHRARSDPQQASATFSTACTWLGLAALVAMLGSLAISGVFVKFFPDVPAERIQEVRLAVLLVGLNVSLTLCLSVFDATLWAMQRFDVINGIDVTVALTRLALTFYLLHAGYGLVALALLGLLGNAGDLVKGIMVRRLDPSLRYDVRLVSRAATRSLMDYGLWNFSLSISRLITQQSAPAIIGRTLGISMVTPYSGATRLLSYSTSLVSSAGEAITPLAATFSAQDKHNHQQTLFVEGGKYCLALALFFLGGFLFLGEPFLRLWLGPQLAYAATFLVILALGETLPTSQIVTRSIVLGMGRPRALALINVIENVLAIGLALLLARSEGLRGVAIAFAIPAALCRGGATAAYACRALDVPWSRYLTQAWLPAMAAASIPALLLGVAVRHHEPRTWVELVGYAGLYGMLSLAVNGLMLIGTKQLWLRSHALLRGGTEAR